MASRVMSDAEIKRRKKAQGAISVATGSLGLAALGTRLGAGAPARAAGKIPKLRKLTPDKMKDASNALATTGAGIGGAGSFNFAAYTNAESRKRGMSTVPKKKPIRKSYEPEGVFGEEGIAKAWTPVNTSYDSEGKRQKRGKAYENAAYGAAGALGAGAAIKAGDAGKQLKALGDAKYRKSKTLPRAGVVGALKSTGKAGALAAGAGAAAVGGKKINQKRKGSWQTYSKNAPGPFGITHN